MTAAFMVLFPGWQHAEALEEGFDRLLLFLEIFGSGRVQPGDSALSGAIR